MATVDDLISRLTAAIDEREKLAREATPGPWTVDAVWHDRAAVEPAVAAWVDFTVGHDPYGTALRKTDAEHIAANGPDVVLRGCAADRKILARHETKIQRCSGHADSPHKADCFDCAYCDTQYWPCLDLRDLAERYEIQP